MASKRLTDRLMRLVDDLTDDKAAQVAEFAERLAAEYTRDHPRHPPPRLGDKGIPEKDPGDRPS